MSARLIDLAPVIRSKNAGPYEMTLDIIFRDHDTYEKVKSSGIINGALIARLYGIKETDIEGIFEFDPAMAIKITFRRQLVSGDVGDTDIYGAQQSAPLMSLVLEGYK